MKYLIQRVLLLLKNFYFTSSLFFIIWLAFIDSNNLFFQARIASKHGDLMKAREFYQDKILEVKNERVALESNPKLLEKLAREKYLMKKEDEDLYIILKEDR
ncbi:MAG: septum formation initiator family protein [Bacteroidota bacterium]